MNIKSFFIILFGIYTFQSNAQQNIDQVFRKYKNDDGVLAMNFTGDVLKMMNESSSKIKSSIDKVEVFLFENKKDIESSDKSKISSLLSRDKFDLLIDVKNKDQKVRLYGIESGQFLHKVYAQVNTPDVNVYFILSGKIIFDELAEMGMDFQKGDMTNFFNSEKKKEIRP
jgi:Domain of unknown function (DUF4252)